MTVNGLPTPRFAGLRGNVRRDVETGIASADLI